MVYSQNINILLNSITLKESLEKINKFRKLKFNEIKENSVYSIYKFCTIYLSLFIKSWVQWN